MKFQPRLNFNSSICYGPIRILPNSHILISQSFGVCWIMCSTCSHAHALCLACSCVSCPTWCYATRSSCPIGRRAPVPYVFHVSRASCPTCPTCLCASLALCLTWTCALRALCALVPRVLSRFMCPSGFAPSVLQVPISSLVLQCYHASHGFYFKFISNSWPVPGYLLQVK